MKLTNTGISMTNERMTEILDHLAKGTMSKGAIIRECFASGMSIKEMSDKTGILYNHCYNVANQEVLKHGLEVEKSGRANGDTKKNQILTLRREGHSLAEISKITQTLYNQVWQVCNKAGLTDKQLNAPTELQVLEEAVG